MIAKGTQHNDGVKLARYMITGKKGERAELWQLRGFVADNIVDAFRDVHIMAEGTRAEQPFFHVQVRNPDGEELTRAQWEKIARRIESKLGLTGQPRAIAFHTGEATGHEHMHIVWSRIDQDTMTARPLPYFKLRLKEVSRELEIRFNLTRVRNEVEGPIKYGPTRAEDEQARRLGIDIRKVRQTIRDCYDRSDCGRGFEAALAEQGLILAKGEKRDFLVIDGKGGMHALGKRVLGVTAREIREKLSDISREQLPTVEQVRSHIKGPEHQDQRGRPEPAWDRDRYHAEWNDAVTRAAIENEKTERRFVEPKPERIKKKGGREKIWPVEPPRPERISTSPDLHFEYAGNETTGQEKAPPMPETLRGVPAQIWTAWHQSDNARAFAAALEEEGISLAVVTQAEADRSHRNAEFARAAGNYAPRYREGEIVAVAEPSLTYRDGKLDEPRVYKLDRFTTGEEKRKVEAFLKPLDRSQLEGIGQTQEKIRARVEQRIVEVQAFRDLLRDMRNEQRMKRAQETGRGKPVRAGTLARKAINSTLDNVLTVPRLADKPVASAFRILGGVGKLADGLFDLIDPPLTPELKKEKEIMARTREAEAENAQDFNSYLAVQRRRHEEERPPDHRERGRERER